MAQNFSQYGPFYGGLLDARQSNQRQQLAEQQMLSNTVGLLSQMESARAQRELVRQQIEQAKLAHILAQRKADMQQRLIQQFMPGAGGAPGGGAPGGAPAVSGPLPTSMDTQPYLAAPQAAAPMQAAGPAGGSQQELLRNLGFQAASKLAGFDLSGVGKLAQSQAEHTTVSADKAAQLKADKDARDNELIEVEFSDRSKRWMTKGQLRELQAQPAQPAARTGVQQFNANAQARRQPELRSPTAAELTQQKVKEQDQLAQAKTWRERADRFENLALKAPSRIDQINLLESLLTGVETGPWAPKLMAAQEYMRSIGINVDWIKNVPQAQAADNIINRMALEMRGSGGGDGEVGMPGAMSEKDREFLVNAFPNITKHPEANRLIAEILRRVEQRNIQVAQLAQRYKEKYGNGRLDDNFKNALIEFGKKNPLFEDLKAQMGQR
jgi:hypothetical protein